MKLFIHVGLFIALAAPITAMADWYVGAKAGTMQIGFDDDEVDSDPSSFGVMAGYRFESILGGGLSTEWEVTRSISAGDVRGLDLEVESQGVYVAYQTQGRFYAKGRLGWMDAALDAGVLSEDEGGETYGVAVGGRLGSWAVELDFTSIDDDVSFLSIGAVWSL